MSTVARNEGWNALLRSWQEADIPEGWHAEVCEGGITMVPPPGVDHNLIAGVVHRALLGAVPREWGVYQTLGISVVGLRRLYVPDLVVMPVEALTRADLDPVPASSAKLVVEIVSPSNARVDRVEKLRAYAEASIPVYLMIDRFDEHGPLVTVFSDPADGHYREIMAALFGSRIELPEPINLKLDTNDFR
ncbi:Endonuclease, Uma2 family (restriction endonuclease fold) [Amycolatopsis xylanica]|uniref:Endonuclease, Uma2 family (Restriction endonuclease fold) n=1 Tax=Amycolatopsis xylanica TaxID=589385 RepID=A0A1H2YQV1_9PSEU|nr:Uma2 family endonuclease [Amycolatopsis xylanica]SDX06899.1 Endonuclease, Uma2 family (restriction endonuclease fold) [Amycolatopsis xylanica]